MRAFGYAFPGVPNMAIARAGGHDEREMYSYK
jgi:hypothetical protein